MKKLFFLAVLFAATPSALADLSHSISSSVKLTVGGASTSNSRLGSSYSVSGVGVDTTHGSGDNAVSNGVGSLVISDGVGTPPDLTVTQDTPGNNFSFTQSFSQADAIPSNAVTTGNAANFSDNVSSIAGGTVGDLAGTVTNSQKLTITAGGANTEALGQMTSTLIVD
tara:strand:+ start:444 stop:947 length:504 start_codon:yes stop_codon:yes gene_type:complete